MPKSSYVVNEIKIRVMMSPLESTLNKNAVELSIGIAHSPRTISYLVGY